MLEVVAMLGCLLLAMDRCVPGHCRERAVVMHVRVSGGTAAVGPSLNAVMALAASSGFHPGGRLPAGEHHPTQDPGGADCCGMGPLDLM